MISLQHLTLCPPPPQLPCQICWAPPNSDQEVKRIPVELKHTKKCGEDLAAPKSKSRNMGYSAGLQHQTRSSEINQRVSNPRARDSLSSCHVYHFTRRKHQIIANSTLRSPTLVADCVSTEAKTGNITAIDPPPKQGLQAQASP